MKNVLRVVALSAGLLIAPLAAEASTLTLIGGSAGQVVGSSFDLTSTTGIANDGTATVTVFDSASSSSEGLFISGDSNVTYTFLGSEAGFTNWQFDNLFGTGTPDFNNKVNTVGDNYTVSFTIASPLTPELLPFSFRTNRGTDGTGDDLLAANGNITNPLYMAFYQYSPTLVVALFGDGTGDRDYDDMAILISTAGQITAVPLPAPVVFLLSGLLGLGFLGRWRARNAG